MDAQEIKQRRRDMASSKSVPRTAVKEADEEVHPAGDIKHGGPKQLLRFFLFTTYFMGGCFS
jgi:hypothetical protein